MKTCPSCRSSFDEKLAICPYCGTIVNNSTPSHYSPNYPAYGQPSAKEPITVGGWIGRSLIPFIPFVGGLVYLIMLFVWSGDSQKEETFRNWAKAQLIVMGIVIVLSIVLLVLIGAIIATESM